MGNKFRMGVNTHSAMMKVSLPVCVCVCAQLGVLVWVRFACNSSTAQAAQSSRTSGWQSTSHSLRPTWVESRQSSCHSCHFPPLSATSPSPSPVAWLPGINFCQARVENMLWIVWSQRNEHVQRAAARALLLPLNTHLTLHPPSLSTPLH